MVLQPYEDNFFFGKFKGSFHKSFGKPFPPFEIQWARVDLTAEMSVHYVIQTRSYHEFLACDLYHG